MGPYRLEEPLGSGGMGTVWRAWDERLKRWVAVKQIRADATVANARERLRREARATARLNHPAIVHIYDILEREDGDWIVMELVLGRTLRGLLDEKGALGPAEAVALGRDIAEGLAEAHGYGILHRDLKASNIMVMPSGRAKILDFGIAKELTREGEAPPEMTLSVPGTVLGTCYAMAPEQALGHPLDPRADLFSLGSLLYEALTGDSPFRAETPTVSLARVLSHRPRPLCAFLPAVPTELSDLVERLLEKDPRNRPQSAGEVVERLGDIAAARPPHGNRRRAEEPGGGGTSSETSHELTLLTLDQRPPAVTETSPTATARHRRRGGHRPVTVVCCGLVGVDESSGETGPLDLEVLSEAMAGLQDLAREACRRHSGQLGAAMGHQVWLYFGYPEAREDDVERAVRAAREIAAGTEDLERRFGTARWKLALRTAVHTGPALVSTRPGQDEQLQLGTTLELATGLQGVAPVRTLVVSAESRRLTARHFAVEALPAVRVVGFEQPVAVFRVLGALDAEEKESGELAPLMGRQRELEILVDRYRLASSGTGQAALISGEAGIGKSRLVRGLRERLTPEDPTWLVAYGSAHTQSSPLAPIIDLLARTIFASGESGTRRDVDRLEEFLTRNGTSLPEAVPLLASLLSLPPEERLPSLSLSPDAQRRKTFEALLAVFEGMAERQPVVLVVEDLHWVDPSTLELLDLLLAQIAALPLLLIATFRPQLQAPWGHQTQATQLSLNRLTDEEVKLLVDRLTEGRELPSKVQAQILARTDGVPLFVEELTRAVLEAGPSVAQAKIPATLGASLAARLDSLGGAKEVAQTASVIGRTFSFDLLQAVSLLEPTVLREGLDVLVHAHMIQRRGVGRRARYAFRHALVQDAAYGSLLSGDRHLLHRQIALALEAALASPDETLAGAAAHPGGSEGVRLLLAHHWSQSLDERAPDPVAIRRAVAHLIAAGEQTLRLSAYEEACSHLEKARALLEELAEGPDRDEQELAVQTRLITVLRAIRGYASDELEKTCSRARTLCLQLGGRRELTQILFFHWSYYLFAGHLEKSLQIAEECLERSSRDDVTEVIMAHSCLGNSLLWLGRLPAALHHAELAYQLAVRHGDHAAEYQSRFGNDSRIPAGQFTAVALCQLGWYEEAAARDRALLRIAEETAHPFTMAIALTTSLWLGRLRNDVSEVLDAAGKLDELSRSKGFPNFEGLAHIHRSWALAQQGRAEEVVGPLLAMPMDVPQQVRLGLANVYRIMASVCWRAHRFEEALRLLEEALSLSREYPLDEAELHTIKGEMLLELAERGRGEDPSRSLADAEAALRHGFTLAAARLQVIYAERSGEHLIRLLGTLGRDREAIEIQNGLREVRSAASGAVRRTLDNIQAHLAQNLPPADAEGGAKDPQEAGG